MAAHNIYESSTIGFGLQKSKQYERFQQINNIVTDDQLIALASNLDNGVIRLYAYQALKQRNTAIPKHLTEKFKNDKTRVTNFHRLYTRCKKYKHNCRWRHVSNELCITRVKYISRNNETIEKA